jgi:hypothetical protein
MQYAAVKRRVVPCLLETNGNFPFQTAPPDPSFRAGSSNPETLAAQRQLAWVLGGSYKGIEPLRTGVPRRLSGSGELFRGFDVAFDRGYSELKFGRDPIALHEIKMDVWLISHGTKVRYDFVPNPCTNEKPELRGLNILKRAGLPHRVWGFRFWRLGRGEGRRLPMTWVPRGTVSRAMTSVHVWRNRC